MATETAIHVPRLISIDGLSDVFEALVADGYRVIGPAVQDGAIVLRELTSAAELPSGWGVELEPGGYQLRRRDDTRPSGTRPARKAGSGSCTRRGSGCGQPRAPRQASRYPGTMTSRPGTRSSASGRATCGRSPSRTGSSPSPARGTRSGAPGCSSSR